MKILFVLRATSLYEPTGVMQLSSIAKKSGHETKLSTIMKGDVEETIKNWKPDVLAYSVMSYDYFTVIEFHKKLKQKYPIFTIFGGPHATFDLAIIKEPSIDAVCVGEGDIAFEDIINKLDRNEDIGNIKNILVNYDQKLELRNRIECLDELPFIDRELFYEYNQTGQGGFKSFYSSRGCPYKCGYCFNKNFNEIYKNHGRVFRKRSVDNLIAEIEEVKKKYPLDFIRFIDDIFVVKKDKWLEEFSVKFPQKIGIRFYCKIRPESFSKELACLLKKSKCYSVCLTVESSNVDFRKLLYRATTNEQIIESFKVASEFGFKIYANTMLGIPGSSEDLDRRDVEFVKSLKPTIAHFTILTPHYGTEIYSYCVDKKYIEERAISSLSLTQHTEKSELNCFTPRYKAIMHNTALLGPLAVKIPGFSFLLFKLFRYLPLTKVYYYIHFLFTLYYYRKMVKTKLTLSSVVIYFRTLFSFFNFYNKLKLKKIPH